MNGDDPRMVMARRAAASVWTKQGVQDFADRIMAGSDDFCEEVQAALAEVLTVIRRERLGRAEQRVRVAALLDQVGLTPEIAERMAQLAASGPPVEQVGIEPYGVAASNLLEIGARR